LSRDDHPLRRLEKDRSLFQSQRHDGRLRRLSRRQQQEPDRLRAQVHHEVAGRAGRHRPSIRRHRHAGKIRGTPARNGETRLAENESRRFEGMPQLSRLQHHGQDKAEGAIEDGKTCIDCHKGIAHKAVHTKLSPEDLAKEGL
jgi:NapC/NirT cytochrome c family, N-terminal region